MAKDTGTCSAAIGASSWVVKAGERPTVLVVEDDAVLRLLLTQVLDEEARCDVTAVDFEDVVLVPSFDLVLTDLPVRRYVAAQAREWVRSLRVRFPATPILVCTAHRQACKEPDRLGADALIAKPFEIAHLLTLTELLTRRPEPVLSPAC